MQNKRVDKNYFPGFTRKSITFTIDDGNFEMDKKFLDIVRPAGIFGTFNLQHWDRETPEFYREMYDGYEIANHCLHHAIAIDYDVSNEVSNEPFDRNRPDYEHYYKTETPGVYLVHIYKIWGKNTGGYEPPRGWHTVSPSEYYNGFADETREGLEEVFGKGSVRGFAWPHGRGSAAAREHLIAEGYQNIRRTGDLRDTTGFAMPEDRFNWSYNASHSNLLEVAELYEKYPDDGNLKFFAIGVHSIDYENSGRWGDLLAFAEKYGNRQNDFYYATVGDILAYEDAVKALVVTDTEIINPSDIPVYITLDGAPIIITANTTVKI
jgi:hypothetical protein